MSDRLVRVERHDRVAVVILDDPGRRNALSLAMVGQISQAMDDLDADEAVGAVVVTGAPPAFCAGADLRDLARASAASSDGGGTGGPSGGGTGGPSSRGGTPPDLGAIYEGFLRIRRSPLPTLAAVNGPAVGAGMNLALACDVRLAGHSARFDARFAALGIHPGGGHTWMLTRAVGPQMAAAVSLFGETLDGPTAERAGLALRSVPDGTLLADAVVLAARAAAVPRQLAGRVKQTLRTMATIADIDGAVAIELEAQRWSLAQPEATARLARRPG